MKEYVDNDTQEELTASLTLMEIARMITYLRAIGLTEKEINDCIIYIGTGVDQGQPG